MEEEIRDIQRDNTDEQLAAWHETPHPQDDVPTELIINYIVADYRNMYNAIARYRTLAELTAKQIENRARELAAPRKAETNELTDLRLEVEEKNRRIEELRDWLSHKECMIAALRRYANDRRQEVSSLQKNVVGQRQQIRSLLDQFDDKYKVMEGCPEAWNSEAWRESFIHTVTLLKQVMELMSIVSGMELGESTRTILTSALDIIRKQVRRTRNSVGKIASPALRKEFCADVDFDDRKEADDDRA